MVCHHPNKFDSHKHCGRGDMFLRVEGQDCTYPCLNPLFCLSLKHMEFHSHSHEFSRRRHNNLLVCPMKDSRSWSHMSTRATAGNNLKIFCQSVQKQ